MRFGDLVGKGRRTTAEEKLMGLLGVLIQDYDRRHALPPDGATPADLIPVFGQRSHVNEALNGKRPIGVAHARKLARMFNVSPSLFI